MDKPVLDTQGKLSFRQNAQWNPGYHFPYWLAFSTPQPRQALSAPFASALHLRAPTGSCVFGVLLLIQLTLCSIPGPAGDNKNITF